MHQKIEQELRAFVIENFLFGQPGTLDNHDSFMEKGIIDSTGILEVLMHLTDTYSIEITPDELIPDNFDSIEQLTNFVNHKLTDGASRKMETVTADAERRN